MKHLFLKSLNHYERMIRWAYTQPKKEHPDSLEMREEIKEDWSSRFCVFCKANAYCERCLLFSKFGCCGGIWRELSRSGTWKQWIEAALKVRCFILEKKLEEEKKK